MRAEFDLKNEEKDWKRRKSAKQNLRESKQRRKEKKRLTNDCSQRVSFYHHSITINFKPDPEIVIKWPL